MSMALIELAVKHTPRAEYAADVHVIIKDAQGKGMLDTHNDGPFLLAKLPAGRYTVTAEQYGQMLTKSADVATRKPVHLLFLWAK